MTYYHVTLLSNLSSIMTVGLVPTIGERSREIGEYVESIYLFTSLQSVEDSLMGWLGDWFNSKYGENEKLALLKISLSDSFMLLDSSAEYEKISKSIINPKFIRLLRVE